MPKIVDHNERRQQVIDAALRVIHRRGLDKTTIRDIADEAGFSIGVLAHYFKDKDDILKSSFQAISDRAFENIRQKTVGHKSALKKLSICIDEFLPQAQETMAIVSLTFWTSAYHDPVLARMLDDGYTVWRSMIRGFLVEGMLSQEIRELSPPALEEEIDLIVSVADGLLVSSISAPERFPQSRQQAIYLRILERLRNVSPASDKPRPAARRHSTA